MSDTDSGSLSTGTIVLAIALIAALAAGAWYLLGRGPSPGADGEVPLIAAAEGPVRERPDDPGGREIPNEDSTVFSLIEPPEEDGAVPPEPEVPISDRETGDQPVAEMPLDKPLAEPDAPAPADGTVEQLLPQVRVQNPEIPISEDARPDRDQSADPGEATENETRDDQPPGEPAPAATPPPDLDAAESVIPEPVSYRVQLGSLGTREAAEQEWERLQDRYRSELGDLILDVQQADLGDRGVFFRIQAGPLDEEGAREVCDVVRSTNPGGCLIVEP